MVRVAAVDHRPRTVAVEQRALATRARRQRNGKIIERDVVTAHKRSPRTRLSHVGAVDERGKGGELRLEICTNRKCKLSWIDWVLYVQEVESVNRKPSILRRKHSPLPSKQSRYDFRPDTRQQRRFR